MIDIKMGRLEIATLIDQFYILPAIGEVTFYGAQYKPRLCVAWLKWGASFGLGRRRWP